MARTWFSNWLVTAPSCVQCPELWTRGAISLATSPSGVTKNSIVRTPTCPSDSMAARTERSASAWSAGATPGAGASVVRRIPPRCSFLLSAHVRTSPSRDRTAITLTSALKSTNAS